jgi:hypothetical protein
MAFDVLSPFQSFYFQDLKVARLPPVSKFGRVYYVAIVAIMEMKHLANKILCSH